MSIILWSDSGGTNAVASASTVGAVASVPSPTTKAAAIAVTSVVAAVATIPAPTVQTQDNVTVTTSVVAAIGAVPAPTVLGSALVTPTVVVATAAVPAPTVLVGTNGLATPSVVAAIAAVPAPTTQGTAVVRPARVIAIATVPAPTLNWTAQATYMFRRGPDDYACWFEKVLPADAPIHANNANILDALGNPAGDGPTYDRGDGEYLYVKFSGGANGSDTNSFDVPIYRVHQWGYTNTTIYIHPKDEAPDYPGGWSGFVGNVPDYMMEGEDGITWPAESTGLWDFFDVEGSSVSSDSPVILYDSVRKYYAQFAEMRYYPSEGKWYCQGVNVFSTDSYGITSGTNNPATIVEPGNWPGTLLGTGYDPADYQDMAGNVGGRGNNPMTRAVDYDRQATELAIFYAIELFAWDTAPSNDYTWPMQGGEDRGTPELVEGTRVRLKRSVNVSNEVDTYLSAATTERRAQVKRVLYALQDYGFVIGDTSGSGSRIRLENTLREGRANLWKMRDDDLKYWNFNPSRWEVIADNYDPPLTDPFFNPGEYVPPVIPADPGLPSSSGSYVDVITGDGPVAWYRFETDDWDKDSGFTGPPHDQSFTFSPSGSNETDGIGGSNGLALTGTGYLHRDTIPAKLRFDGPMSVEAWFRYTGSPPTGSRAIVAERQAISGVCRWTLHFETFMRPCFAWYNGAWQGFPSNATEDPDMPPDVWHYIVGLYTGSSLQTYLNTELITEDTSPGLQPGTSSDGEWMIAKTNNFGNEWIGDIDEVAFYDYALSEAQIIEHYEAGQAAVTSSLYGYW